MAKAAPFNSCTGRTAAAKSNSARDRTRWTPEYYREIARRGGQAGRGKRKRRRTESLVPQTTDGPLSREILAVVAEMDG